MEKIAKRQNIVFQWLCWYFWDMPREILRGWKNFLRFNLDYFSIALLLKSLFSYWRRYYYSYGQRFDFKRHFEAFTFNLTSRMLGAIMRIFLIMVGLFAEAILIILGIIILISWFTLPAFLIAGLFFGLKIIF